jgi:hypothetical protein
VPTPEDVHRAIASVEASRYSHVTWVAWYVRHPEDEAKYAETCGGRAHHEKCIAEYDHVLGVLRSIAQPAA